MDERRNAERFPIVNLSIFNQVSGELIGNLVNISETGLSAISLEEYSLATRLALRIPFKSEDNNDVLFDFVAEVVWVAPKPEMNGKVSVGLKMIELGDLQYRFLRKMVELYGTTSTE